MWNERFFVEVKLREWVRIWNDVEDKFLLDFIDSSDDVKVAISKILSTENTHEIIEQIDFVISKVIEILVENKWIDDEIDIKKIIFKKWKKETVIKVWEWNEFIDFIKRIFKWKKKKHKKW